MSQATYIIDDNKLYREDPKGLYTDYVLCVADPGDATPHWTGPKIPFEMFREMTAWCEETQRRLKSEAMVLLFLDDNNEWQHWYCPQITSGLSVESDDKNDLYTVERKNFSDRQLGTLHHHCDISAFQSGTDSSDEEDRDGLHFTIGNLGSKEYSLHARFCINGKSHDCDAEDLVEPPAWMENVPENLRPDIMKALLSAPTTEYKKDHFKDRIAAAVSKKVYSHIGYSHTGGIGNTYKREELSEEIAVERLLKSTPEWWSKGVALAQKWFNIPDKKDVDVADIAQSIEAEVVQPGAFSTECMDLNKKLRKALGPSEWIGAQEIANHMHSLDTYLQDLAAEDAEDAADAATAVTK